MLKRGVVFVYGVLCYGLTLVVLLYAVGFLGNVGVPKAIDSPRTGSLSSALLIDLGLLALFAVQHSLMARPTFKAWWTRIVPEPAERSTYTLFSNLCLAAVFWQWRPLGGPIWDVSEPTLRLVIWAVFAAGWVVVLASTALIHHFDLFGLRQVWLYWRGQEYTPLPFKTPGLYRFVRHPLYVGWFMVFWATPTMTLSHLFFAVVTTAYILVAVRLEERDLLAHHGPVYAEYRKRVPRFIPRPCSSTEEEQAAAAAGSVSAV